MNCPKCGSAAIYVVDTMPGLDERVYRRRKCVDCNARFHTAELIITDDELLKQGYTKAYLKKAKNRYRKEKKDEKQ